MNSKTALCCLGLIVVCGILYGKFFAENPIQPQYKPYFYVYPNDLNEYEVVLDSCIKVYEYDSIVAEIQDTQTLIQFLTKPNGTDWLGLWIYKDSCMHYEPDSLHAAKALYQMVEGAECLSNRWGENVIAFY